MVKAVVSPDPEIETKAPKKENKPMTEARAREVVNHYASINIDKTPPDLAEAKSVLAGKPLYDPGT